jgi:F5/8 type C domain
MRRRDELGLLAAVSLAVAGAHVWMIWMAPTALSFSPRHIHTDNAVMLMMAKHVLEKGEFPIFYYGQDWFGSLSALIHAAVFLVLGGIPPWSIHVAPLLFFLGFGLVLYLLTREALGPAVALWALAWTIVTPVRLSEYTVMPHGGYIEGLMLGTTLLWLAVRLVRAPEGWRKRGYYALLGFVGGLGWWTSPLVVYQLLTCGVYVLMRERGAAVSRGAILSLPAFFVGAGPFFYFYAVDSYSRVSNLGGGYALGQVPEGLYLLFVERVPEYLDWDLFGVALPFAAGLAAVVYGGATLALLWGLRTSFRRDHPHGAAAVFPIFFLVFVLLCAASIHVRRAAPQYALPLSAFFPVALGFWLVHARGKWKLVAWSGGAALFLLHAWTTAAWVVGHAPRAEALIQGHLGSIRGLEAKGAEHLYVQPTLGSELLNFYARERIIASLVMNERYQPNMDALERDPAPAFLFARGNDTLTPTLAVLGGSSATEPVDDYDLIRHLREEDRRYRQIPAAALRVSASHERPTIAHVVDRDQDSVWTSLQPKRPGMWVELDLGRPFDVGMIRLWNRGEHHGNYAMDARIDTSVDGKTWHEAVKRSSVDYFYWSGPRLYGWEWGYRWEARFPPTAARLVRITQYEEDRRAPWMIAEAYVYEDVGMRPPGPPGEQDVLRRIRELGLERVYADRWLSARIAESFQGRVETVKPFTVAIPEFYVRLRSRVIQWSDRTGFVVEDSDADEFERQMREEDAHRLAREELGRWVLFHPKATGASVGGLPGDPGWWWMGLGVVKTGSHRAKSRYLAELGREAYRDGEVARAVGLSRRAVDAYPLNHAARRTLIQALDRLGHRDEAAAESRKLTELIEPQVKTSAEFRETLQFLGYTLDGGPARPGRDVKVRYFWKVKRDPGPKATIGVFVHVEGADRRFQGDFRFLEGQDEEVWPVRDDEILSQEAWLRIPPDATPGPYRILLGVYDVPTRKRWPVSASDPRAQRERVPVGVLQVGAAGAP